jgi:hypothetical protein
MRRDYGLERRQEYNERRTRLCDLLENTHNTTVHFRVFLIALNKDDWLV